ncbi:hypothetical protein BWQ96_09435 [Gracilariopsis chorda]|uniref:Uncharacterized protein n=1 Tax=Gracilariopsis chorda TaxID=448386 RepID=A0A2V3IFH4_9FLOR|nr:hypothetical protein BWQ96_09435 [Gracilariopsis chorda]|eukprot:PXF40845.1 hypothetical protein BWQ96_09435 [Gracilariopsis chorda]
MSFLRCCVGADPRPPPDNVRPVSASHRRTNPAAAASAYPSDPSVNKKKKMKLPTEVFFDPTKPDGQLSSVTDPPNSNRDCSDPKKRKEHKDRSSQQREARKHNSTKDRTDLQLPDNNGLTRGQNFMKVEKWLRSSCKHQQVDITPKTITNIEDGPTLNRDSSAEPPSEKDRLPQHPIANHHQSTAPSR